MLYLIGGVPRVGKSTLANLILERNKIAYVDADWIVSMLMIAAPQLGIKYATKFTNEEYIKKAENFFPFLYQFIKYNQPVVEKYLIEGDSFLPRHVSKLQKEVEIKACFLGLSKLKPETLLNNPSKNDWWIKKLTTKQLDELCDWVENMSSFLKKECGSYSLPYFDLSSDYQNTLEKAYDYLVS